MASPVFPDWDNNYTLRPLKSRQAYSVYCNSKFIGRWAANRYGAWNYTPFGGTTESWFSDTEFNRLLTQCLEIQELKRKYGNKANTLYKL